MFDDQAYLGLAPIQMNWMIADALESDMSQSPNHSFEEEVEGDVGVIPSLDPLGVVGADASMNSNLDAFHLCVGRWDIYCYWKIPTSHLVSLAVGVVNEMNCWSPNRSRGGLGEVGVERSPILHPCIYQNYSYCHNLNIRMILIIHFAKS